MKIIETSLPGVLIIEPEVFDDARGYFLESFNAGRYAHYGIPGNAQSFVQENSTRSARGVLRGIHFQKQHPQGKLFSVSNGYIFDVVADVRPESPCFRQWIGTDLSESNHRQIWIPQGYAHGFCVLSDIADVHYRCTDYFYPEDAGGVIWNDPMLAINWPVKAPILSPRDVNLPGLDDCAREQLPR